MVNDQELRNAIAVSLGASFSYRPFRNITGCLIMGFFATLALQKIPSIPLEVL